MADTLFKIVFEGQLRHGVEPQTARLNLAQLFKSEAAAVEKLFSGQPIALKRGLNQTDAQIYLKALNDAGVEARIEADPAITLSLDDAQHSTTQQLLQESPAPSPYAPPRATVGEPLPEYAELKVFSLRGRIGRLRYMAWFLALTVATLLATGVCLAVMSFSLVGGGLLLAVILAAFALISMLMGVQRLHDAGWSGWLLLLNLVPFIGSLFPFLMILIPGNQGANQYGPPPPPNTRGVKVLAWMWLLFFALLFVFSLLGGLTALQEELEAGTVEYEQSLLYDDSEDTEQAQPATPGGSTSL